MVDDLKSERRWLQSLIDLYNRVTFTHRVMRWLLPQFTLPDSYVFTTNSTSTFLKEEK
jgi:hypothetical protein